MTKTIISTDAAPAAIGSYSQAVKAGELIFVSGQIPLDPQTMELVSDVFEEQVSQVFKNLRAVAEAADSGLDKALKLTVYLTDLSYFSVVNQVMAEFVPKPYPARAAVEVAALPKGALVEIDAILSA
jgi:reactive intermediate/imine deaminase